MKLGTIEVEGTGLTAGHPPIIISGKIKAGTVCAVNGLLTLDKTTGEYEAFDFDTIGASASIALEKITGSTTAAKVLMHGTFDGTQAVKADGSPLTTVELAAVQANSQIFFV